MHPYVRPNVRVAEAPQLPSKLRRGSPRSGLTISSRGALAKIKNIACHSQQIFFKGLYLFSKQTRSKSRTTNQSTQIIATLSELKATARKRQSKKLLRCASRPSNG